MLSKTRFLAGLQCSKLLWLRVHERGAPELAAVDPALQSIFDDGTRVGELARERFPGSILIPPDESRVEATREAIEHGASGIFEASFFAGDVFAAVDVLLRDGNGWCVIEVKATTAVKPPHIPDAAVQLYVLERAGLAVTRVEIMHLDRACRHPDLSNLFRRVDVTAQARAFLAHVPARVAEQTAVLAGSLPVVATGNHCNEPYPCPFQARCLPPLPEHHVSTLYRGGRLVAELLSEGVERIDQIPEPLDGIRERQRRAVSTSSLVVEGDLGDALTAFQDPVAFVDFETVSPAVPRWSGCGPYSAVPVQFSVHVEDGPAVSHKEWLAAGPDDPRRPLALALLEACRGARSLVAYNAPFERAGIEALAAACPDMASDLGTLADRMLDLLPVVRDHVYHPAFGGSFALKAVLPALVGEGYEDLAIADGGNASVRLSQLLFGAVPEGDRDTLRRDLLAYCKRDTWALVQLLRRLRELTQNWRTSVQTGHDRI
jgi:hypothetical protein